MIFVQFCLYLTFCCLPEDNTLLLLLIKSAKRTIDLALIAIIVGYSGGNSEHAYI